MDHWAVNLDLKVQASATSSAVTSVIELTDLSRIGNDGADQALAGGAILEAVGGSGIQAGGGPIEVKAEHKINIEGPSHE